MFLFATVLAVLSRTMLRFGWEHVSFEDMNDDAYVHQLLTRRACNEYYARFAPPAPGEPPRPMPAASAIVWHTDYIDSYLYNPLFWAGAIKTGDGLDRLKVSVCLRHDLEALHFDDLTSVDQIEQMWTRYLGGSIAGLLWAAQRRDVAGAHNVLGATLHPIQDFYSHSSWVDESGRRTRPWPETDAAARSVENVYTGTYETPEHLGQHPHGRVSLECSLMRAVDVGPVMDIACSGLSPLNKLTPCQIYDRCKDARTVSTNVLGVQLPEGLVYLDPPGIALDSGWQAKIGRQLRDIPAHDAVTAEELYRSAQDLAVATSVWWLQTAGDILTELGHGDFWAEVASTDTYSSRFEQFEDFSRLPFRFVAATPYPPAPGITTTAADWYLRLGVRTSSETDSGTNGTVTVRAEGADLIERDRRWTELNYGKDASAVVEYNDLSTGDVQTYMIGPFTALPTALTFQAEGSDVGDVLGIVWDGFVSAIEGLLETLGDFFLSIIGGHADFVGQRKVLWSPEQLDAIGTEPVEFREFVDGDDEGQYNVFGRIRRVEDANAPHRHRTFEVSIDRLQCWEESDEASDSDEPFMLALLVNLADHGPGRVQRFRTSPYSMDRRQTVDVGHVFARVHVPEGSGMLALPIAVYESDQESAAARDELLRQFAGEAETSTQSHSDQLVEAVGALFGSDWRLGGLDVFAFRHAPSAGRAGTVLSADVERWIDAGTQWRIELGEPERWWDWQLPASYAAGLGVRFSHQAWALFAAADYDGAAAAVSDGAARLAAETAGPRPAPLGEVRDELQRWLAAAAAAHPHDVPRQCAAARSAWALLRYLEPRIALESEFVATGAQLRQLVGLLTFGTPDATDSVTAAEQLEALWARSGIDHEVELAELWSAVSLRQHETAFHPEVAADPERQAAELGRQRATAQRAATHAYPLATAGPSSNDTLIAIVLRRLVGTLTFGSADLAPGIEAAELAAGVWGRAPGDHRYDLAELWMAMSLRHHETAFHPDIASDPARQAVELAEQRRRASQSALIAIPLADENPESNRAALAVVLRRLTGLLLTGADPADPATAELQRLSEQAADLAGHLEGTA